jgi:hypothetical protein
MDMDEIAKEVEAVNAAEEWLIKGPPGSAADRAEGAGSGQAGRHPGGAGTRRGAGARQGTPRAGERPHAASPIAPRGRGRLFSWLRKGCWMMCRDGNHRQQASPCLPTWPP